MRGREGRSASQSLQAHSEIQKVSGGSLAGGSQGEGRGRNYFYNFDPQLVKSSYAEFAGTVSPLKFDSQSNIFCRSSSIQDDFLFS